MRHCVCVDMTGRPDCTSPYYSATTNQTKTDQTGPIQVRSKDCCLAVLLPRKGHVSLSSVQLVPGMTPLDLLPQGPYRGEEGGVLITVNKGNRTDGVGTTVATSSP